MIELINFTIMVISMVLTFLLYSISIQPAKLKKTRGILAYKICTNFRTASGVFMIISGINFFIYPLYPLKIQLSASFPWNYWISLSLSLVILIPGLILIIIAYKFAGKETMSPQKDGKLLSGIYSKIRHPQYLGEAPMWCSFALILNSPMLTFISLGWIAIFITWAFIEENDLEKRFGSPYIEYKKKTGMFFPRIKIK